MPDQRLQDPDPITGWKYWLLMAWFVGNVVLVFFLLNAVFLGSD